MGSGTSAGVLRRSRRDRSGAREVRSRPGPGPGRKCVRRPVSSPDPPSPTEVPASPAAAQPGLPRAALPLMKVRCSPECCMRTNRGVVGLPRSRHGLGISPGPCAVSLRPPSAPSFDGVSSSRELYAFSRVLRPARCPSCLIESCEPTDRPKSASHGVHIPHRDIDRRRPPLRGESRPRGHVPSSTFPTSSTASSATCLRGLVPSRCHVQGLPSRGLSLSAEPCRVSPADSCPPAVERVRL